MGGSWGAKYTTKFIGAKHDNEFYGWPQTAEQRIKRINEFLGGEGLGRRMTTNFIIGLRRHNNELNELTNFLGGEGLGRSMTTNFIIGLGRRNNELNKLTNFLGGEVAGIAPERGSYSRIGACPYLSPQLINSRFCPCKGRISWVGLAPQQDSRYEPLTGARFINRPQKVGASPYPKYEPLTGRVFKIHIIFMSKLSPK